MTTFQGARLPEPHVTGLGGVSVGSNGQLLTDVYLSDGGAARLPLSVALASDGSSLAPSGQRLTPLPLQAASKATRTSADISTAGAGGLNLVVAVANRVGAATITPAVQGKTLSGAYYTLWTAAAALAANSTAVYQLSAKALASAGGVTEGKIALIPSVVRVVLTYAGNGTTDAFDTAADLDVTV